MSRTPLQRFWGLLSQFKPELRLIYILAIFNGFVNLSLPLGIQAIINFIQTGEATVSWFILVFFVLLGILFSGIFQVLQLRIVENIQQAVFTRSAFEFAYRLPKISFKELDKIHAPELANRFFDTINIQKGLPKILIDFSLASFQIVFGLILLAIYSPFFIILGVSLFFILWIVVQVTGPSGLETSLKESKYKYSLAHWLEEVARVNYSFKTNMESELHIQRTDEITTNYLGAREKHFRILLHQFKYFIGFKVFVAASLLLLGGYLVFEERMNIGQFVAAEIIIILIINSVEKLLRVIDTIYDVLTGLEKIGIVTDLELDKNTGVAHLDTNQGIHVKTQNLQFAYPEMAQYVINDYSIDIPSNKKAIVKGETGSGKSTLLQLLSGVLHPSNGQVLYNDIPIRNYSSKALYSAVGVTFPTNQLFEGTIKENITLGRDISEKELSNLTKVLNLNQYIAQQPLGMQSIIDSGGRRLPRSIIQKIQIARVLLGKPKLLILEDPLQFVSDEEKKLIIDYITDPVHEWTVVVVADYKYWEEKCDLTITLDKN